MSQPIAVNTEPAKPPTPPPPPKPPKKAPEELLAKVSRQAVTLTIPVALITIIQGFPGDNPGAQTVSPGAQHLYWAANSSQNFQQLAL